MLLAFFSAKPMNSYFYMSLPSSSSSGVLSARKNTKSIGAKHILGLALMATLALATMFGGYIPAAHAATAIDGTADFQGACTPFCTATLTTTSTNDVIIVFFTSVPTPAGTPPISDASSLSWLLRTSVSNTGGILYEYYATSAAALTADAIKLSASIAGVTGTIYAFGISGANVAGPFDPHGGIPATVSASASPFNLAITTSDANDMIIGAIQGSSTAFAVAAPNTEVDAQCFATAAISCVEYDIVGAAGTYTVSFTSGGPAASEIIADAVCAAGGAGCTGGGSPPPTSIPEIPFQLALPIVFAAAIGIYALARRRGSLPGLRMP